MSKKIAVIGIGGVGGYLAGIDCVAEQDIEAEIWRKYMFNCAYNVMTAHYMQTIGELRADEEKVKEFRELLTEAYRVAKAKGVNVTEDFIEKHMERFQKLAAKSTSSLQRDVAAGKKDTEFETFCGYIVKQGEKLGVDVPVTERFYK